MTIAISTLNPGDRFLIDPQDAIEYVYLYEGSKGKHVAALAHRREQLAIFAPLTLVEVVR